MACTREQHAAVMSIGRANPGVKIDVQNSSSNVILLVHEKKQKRWVVNRKGKIRRVAVV